MENPVIAIVNHYAEMGVFDEKSAGSTLFRSVLDIELNHFKIFNVKRATRDLSIEVVYTQVHGDDKTKAVYRLFKHGAILRLNEGESDEFPCYERVSDHDALEMVSDFYYSLFKARPKGITVYEATPVPEKYNEAGYQPHMHDSYRMYDYINSDWCILFASTAPDELVLASRRSGRRFVLDLSFANLDRDDPLVKEVDYVLY